MNPQTCFHCHLPIPVDSAWTCTLQGETRHFCCPACRTVAEVIHEQGLDDYYRFRDHPGNRPETSIHHPFDQPAFHDQLITHHDDCDECRLAVEGLHCAACVWLIESRLQHLPGVQDARVNLDEQRLRIQWDPNQQSLGALARAVESLGYRLSPWHPEALLGLQQREYRQSLLRLGIAGIAMMQTGMLAAALYLGDYQDMEPQWREFLRWVSLVFALPVATYAAWPFYRNAIAGLQQGQAVMDLPVALAIAGAFLASCASTALHSEHVYFDSVVMFTFFLLAGRHLEMVLRHRNRRDSLIDHETLPWQACRLQDGHDLTGETIPALLVKAGDRLRVKPGEAIPVDGIVLEGRSAVDESVITGESQPVPRGPGEHVLAGSVNTDQTLVMEAAGSQYESRVARLRQHLDHALSRKPAISALADRWASAFISLVIAAAAATFWWSWPLGIDTAVARVLAVLVASCPCALSLATPAALAATGHALARSGWLVTRSHVIETLPHITTVAFDKTGTLTEGRLAIRDVQCSPGITRDEALGLASALEQHSSHPVARAFQHYPTTAIATDVCQLPAQGITGQVGHHTYRLGHAAFLQQPSPDEQQHWIGLADDTRTLAWFALADRIRADAAATVHGLQAQGMTVELLTGDRSGEAQRVADALGITTVTAGASPEYKRERILALQQAGKCVMMVGDGINDAAVLASANVSVAVADASSLARLQSDVILTRPSLSLLLTARQQALATRRIIRQNLAWAAGYNAAVVPLAALGWIPPWLAAIGMSTSSLLVTLNAMRLSRIR